jgi:hypothetical protein
MHLAVPVFLECRLKDFLATKMCFRCIFQAYMRNEPHPTLVDFEQRIGLGSTGAARLLGLPYITYAQYRSGERQLKTCHVRHIEALLLLQPSSLSTLIESYTNGSRTKNNRA